MNLRWIMRDGEKVLQYVPDNCISLDSNGNMVPYEKWEDVSTYTEPEKKVEITADQIDSILGEGSPIFLDQHSSLYDMSQYFKKKLGLI